MEFEGLTETLRQCGNAALPTIWLRAATGSKEIAYIGANAEKLSSGLPWGKPFIPSSFAGGHNIQFPRTLFPKDINSSLILLHLPEYSLQQRLATNKTKLVKRRFVGPDLTYEEIALLDTSSSKDPTVERLVAETKKILSKQGKAVAYDTLPSDCLQFEAGGQITFSDLKSKTLS